MNKVSKIKQTQQRKSLKVSPLLIMRNIDTAEASCKLYRQELFDEKGGEHGQRVPHQPQCRSQALTSGRTTTGAMLAALLHPPSITGPRGEQLGLQPGDGSDLGGRRDQEAARQSSELARSIPRQQPSPSETCHKHNRQHVSVGGCGFSLALASSGAVSVCAKPSATFFCLDGGPTGLRDSSPAASRDHPSAVRERFMPACPSRTLPSCGQLPGVHPAPRQSPSASLGGPPGCLGVQSSAGLHCLPAGLLPRRASSTWAWPARFWAGTRAMARRGFAAWVWSRMQKPSPVHPGRQSDSARHKPHTPALIYVQDRRQVSPWA